MYIDFLESRRPFPSIYGIYILSDNEELIFFPVSLLTPLVQNIHGRHLRRRRTRMVPLLLHVKLLTTQYRNLNI